jgi:hypothetical protein
MENPFKKILHQEEVPKVLKDRVLNDVAMIKLSIDVAELFVVKYPNAMGDLLNGGSMHSEKEEEDEEDQKE